MVVQHRAAGVTGVQSDEAGIRAAKGYKTSIFSPFAVPLFFTCVYAK